MNPKARLNTTNSDAPRPWWPHRLWRAFELGVTRRLDLLSPASDADGPSARR